MDLSQKPHEPMALVLESAIDVIGHRMVWELVLDGVDLALEVFFLLPGSDPTVDSSLGNDGLFRFPGGEWTVVDSIGQLDAGDVLSFVVRVLNTLWSFLAQLRRLDVEIPSGSAASLGVFGSTESTYMIRWLTVGSRLDK